VKRPDVNATAFSQVEKIKRKKEKKQMEAANRGIGAGHCNP